MAQQLIDITGEKVNKLKVLKFVEMRYEGGHNRSYWECECDCGNIVILRKDDFYYSYSKTKSCGCWLKEEHSIRAKTKKRDKDGRFLKE